MGANAMVTAIVVTLSLLVLAGCLRSQMSREHQRATSVVLSAHRDLRNRSAEARIAALGAQR